MLVAASSLRGHGPWVINGGWEYTVALATVGATIALTGAGSASIDNALGLDWPPDIRVAGVALGATAAMATLVLRRLDQARPRIASGADRALDEEGSVEDRDLVQPAPRSS